LGTHDHQSLSKKRRNKRMTQGEPRRHPQMTMRSAALFVVRRLQRAGHVALFAGGCVRDMVMGKRPHDYDIATSATPPQVLELFRRTQKVGAKFGVVLVRLGTHAIEVATFRKDMEYTDGRRPSGVQFTDAVEDATRRDFTINGMFYDPVRREIIDHVNGQADIAARTLRAIGDPAVRFAEDHLRLLRAIRFAARFDFKIETRTWKAMEEHAPSIAKISPERILGELEMILVSPKRARAFIDIAECGLLFHLWSGAEELRPHVKSIGLVLAELPAVTDFETAFAAVLHPLPHAASAKVSAALRCSNICRRITTWLVAQQDVLADPDALSLADLKTLMAHEAFGRLLVLFAAKLRAAGKPLTPYRKIMARIRAIKPVDIAPPPFVTGDDLTDAKVPRGPLYKKILDRVYYAQLNEEITDRPAALKLTQQLLKQS
jgi:poly(A) polymerase